VWGVHSPVTQVPCVLRVMPHALASQLRAAPANLAILCLHPLLLLYHPNSLTLNPVQGIKAPC